MSYPELHSSCVRPYHPCAPESFQPNPRQKQRIPDWISPLSRTAETLGWLPRLPVPGLGPRRSHRPDVWQSLENNVTFHLKKSLPFPIMFYTHSNLLWPDRAWEQQLCNFRRGTETTWVWGSGFCPPRLPRDHWEWEPDLEWLRRDPCLGRSVTQGGSREPRRPLSGRFRHFYPAARSSEAEQCLKWN